MRLRPVNRRLIAFALCFPVHVFAQTWTQTSAPTKNWSSIACSADGSRLVAGINTGVIYSSTNFGITWATNNVPNLAWNSVASSGDGSKLVAAYSGGVYTSTNFGATWRSNNVPNYFFSSTVSTGDGSTFAAISSVLNSVFVSTNSSGIWVTNHFPPNIFDGYCMGLSASGARLFAGNNVGIILTSTNLGTTWNQTNRLVSGLCKSIAVSADGTKVAASFGGKNIFLSTNAGASWISNSIPFTTFAVAISADASKLAVIGTVPSVNSPVLTSKNFGASWVSNSLPFANSGSLAVSADGNQLVAALNGGGIWIFQSTPNPHLNIANEGANTKISWTVPSTNFVLQQSADLSSWSPVTNPPVLNLTNLQNQVTLPPSGNSGFYRLKTP